MAEDFLADQQQKIVELSHELENKVLSPLLEKTPLTLINNMALNESDKALLIESKVMSKEVHILLKSGPNASHLLSALSLAIQYAQLIDKRALLQISSIGTHGLVDFLNALKVLSEHVLLHANLIYNKEKVAHVTKLCERAIAHIHRTV